MYRLPIGVGVAAFFTLVWGMMAESYPLMAASGAVIIMAVLWGIHIYYLAQKEPHIYVPRADEDRKRLAYISGYRQPLLMLLQLVEVHLDEHELILNAEIGTELSQFSSNALPEWLGADDGVRKAYQFGFIAGHAAALQIFARWSGEPATGKFFVAALNCIFNPKVPEDYYLTISRSPNERTTNHGT